MSDSQKTCPPRYVNIDVLRGIAVVFMLNQHIGVWMIDHLNQHPFIYLLNGLGGMAAPLFVTLSGLGTVFLSFRHDHPDMLFIKRGAAILLSGYLLNILVPSWFSPASWYVLHMIGGGILFSPLLRHVSDRTLIFLIVLILFLTILGQTLLATPLHIHNRRMGSINMPGGILRLVFFEGHFPIFPWLAFFIAGMLSGRWYLENRKGSIFFLGSVLLLICILFSTMPYISTKTTALPFFKRLFTFYPSFYPALTPVTLMLMSFSLFSIFIFILLEKKCDHPKVRSLECMGRISLTILITHAIIFREGSIRFSQFKKMGGTETFLMITFAIAIYACLSFLWEKKSYAFSLEWMIRKI